MEVQKYGVTQRYVEETDTEFILSLRTNNKLGKFLSPTMNDIQQQKNWIKAYKIRESNKEDFYFITLDEYGNKLGLTRIYNFDQSSFEFGSWIFARKSQIKTSINALFCTLDFGLQEFAFPYFRTTVRKKNRSMNSFHQYFNPVLENEDLFNFYYKIKLEDYEIGKSKFSKK